MQEESVTDKTEVTTKNETGMVKNAFNRNESDGDLISDMISPTNPTEPAVDQNPENEERRADVSEEEYDAYMCDSPSALIKTSEDESGVDGQVSESEDEREAFHRRYSQAFDNWQYSDEERKWLRYQVEMLNRNECIVFCILGHIILDREEMQGTRYTMMTPDHARQALISLSYGSQWDVKNLAVLMAFQDKVNLVEKYVSTLLSSQPYRARRVIKNMLLKMLSIK